MNLSNRAVLNIALKSNNLYKILGICKFLGYVFLFIFFQLPIFQLQETPYFLQQNQMLQLNQQQQQHNNKALNKENL